MARLELTMTDDEKARLEAAAKASQLRLGTWAKAQLLLLAIKAEKQ
jgi:hypothetical protein